MVRPSFVLAALTLCAGAARAQGPGTPPDGPPAVLPLPALAAPVPTLPAPGQVPVLVPRPDAVYVYDTPPPALPSPEEPAPWRFGQPPGWFVALEAAAVRPHTRTYDLFDGPGNRTDLDGTVMPQGTLGYKFQHGGSLLLTFRHVASEGNFDNPSGYGPFNERDRFDASWLDLNYLSRPYGPWLNMRLQWQLGVRSAYLFADAQAQFTGAGLTDHSHFWGAGPDAGLTLSWALRDTGLALFAHFDAAVLIGQTTERYASFYTNLDGSPSNGQDSWRKTRGAVDVRGELGLSWTVPARHWLRFDVGVQSQTFFWNGLEVNNVGPFARCVFGF